MARAPGSDWPDYSPDNVGMRRALLLQAELHRYESRALTQAKMRRMRIVSMIFAGLLVALTLAVAAYYVLSGVASTEQPPQWIAAQGVVAALLGAGIAALTATYQTLRHNRERRAEYETTMSRAENGLNRMTIELYEKDQQIEALKRQLRRFEAAEVKRRRPSKRAADFSHDALEPDPHAK